MANEVLCKFLCHNLSCLIMEQETLGIAPVFWKDVNCRTMRTRLPSEWCNVFSCNAMHLGRFA